MFTCPKCSAEIEAVSQKTFDDKQAEHAKKRDEQAAELKRLRPLAEQAAPLAARVHGYRAEPEVLAVLQARHAAAQTAGYEGDLAAWLGDAEAGQKDVVAGAFRSSTSPATTPATTTPATTPPTTPATTTPATTTPQKPALPTSTTVATAPATTPKLTPEQAAQQTSALRAKYRDAKTDEERAKIRGEIDEVHKQARPAG